MAKYAPGTPCWVDLGSPDVEASAQFYNSLFGWTSQASGPEYGGYTNFFSSGKLVCAVGPLQGPGQPPVWTTYFHATDVDALTVKAEQAGGKVIAPPMEIPPFGKMAILLDPTGAAFGAWQPQDMHGFEVTGEAGAVGWFELLTPDIEGASAFYPAVLGLDARVLDFGGGTYVLLEDGGESVAGMMPPGPTGMPAGVPPHWMVYFTVEDPDAVAARAAELGGRATVPPTDSPAGRWANLVDPHGAPFAIIKPDPNFKP